MTYINKLISKTREDKEIAIATFLDNEGAFNNARTHSLAEALAKRETGNALCQWGKAMKRGL